MALRRLFLTITILAVMVPLGALPAGAHNVDSESTTLAAPEESGEGTAMKPVANVQYETERIPATTTAPERFAAQNGSDIEFLKVGAKEYALAGTLRNGMQIVDITDPSNPRVAAVYDCPITQGDIQVFKQGSRILATYTADAAIAPTDFRGTRSELIQRRFESQCVKEANADGSDIDGSEVGTFLVDLTDPTNPKTVSFIEIRRGSHNQTIHPSGNYLYNSNSDLITSMQPEITITDVSDPENPEKVQEFRLPFTPTSLGSESHDIFFNAKGDRAYVAALSQTFILDTTDPEQPKILNQIVDPSINVVHQSDLISLPREDGTKRDILIITDEQAGAAVNPNCPGGGLHVYDVTGDKELEGNEDKLGIWFIDSLQNPEGGACTSHVLRLYEDQQMMTIAWYDAGVRVLDVSGLAEFEGSPTSVARGEGIGMREIGHYTFPDSDTWSFKTNRIAANGSFFGYGNDLARGLDVFRFQGDLNVPPLEPVDFGPAPCDDAPKAREYVDRDEARKVHRPSVDCAIFRNLAVGRTVDGEKVFEPRRAVTRDQMATFIVNTLVEAGYDDELPEAGDVDRFDDLAGNPHRGNINRLARAGVVAGTGDGRYSPNARVSRAQMATFLVRAADFVLERDLESDGDARFRDVAKDNTHKRSIEVGADNGLFSGETTTTFGPKGDVERDQMATFLVNLLTVVS